MKGLYKTRDLGSASSAKVPALSLTSSWQMEISSFFADKRVFDAEFSVTIVALLGYIQHLQIEVDSRVVHELLPAQKSPSQNVRADGQSAAILVVALIPFAHIPGRSSFDLVNEGSFRLHLLLLRFLACSLHSDGMLLTI